ncbi:beta-glucosidase [Methylobacterium frigidaeris]|uniref:Beta-glucosidase n=1 Tax=Methylobacterium frigidaeris TaxID=2038277 RepID=A0AA37M945_9HYPH|nr:beta-glucosidase [Methylobacterium frigidaeris]GJD66701.1 hypothetical protein MPEAHAMD_6899 [Methylobacterium frigidaeris]
MSTVPSPFESFFLAGFECSSQRRADGRRLDLLAATGHDTYALADYRSLRAHGILAARDGLRWHRIETAPGRYDWSSALPMIEAAAEAGIQVVWDLCHYGWPDDLDIWSDAFVPRFAAFAAEAARRVREVSGAPPFVCPVNEISYFAWAGAEVGRIGPLATGRGAALKRQLVRASLAGMRAVREVDPAARFLHAEPAIHVVGDPESEAAAAAYRAVQYEALDMVGGRLAPELGGSSDFLDFVGVNFYPDNQWIHGGSTIPLGHHAYRPFRVMLAETHARYGRPLLVAETGAEGTAKAAWLHYVCGEVRAARATGVPVLGVCLYPILDYPGWDNDRPCAVGLFHAHDPTGHRGLDRPLAEELSMQAARFSAEGNTDAA